MHPTDSFATCRRKSHALFPGHSQFATPRGPKVSDRCRCSKLKCKTCRTLPQNCSCRAGEERNTPPRPHPVLMDETQIIRFTILNTFILSDLNHFYLQRRTWVPYTIPCLRMTPLPLRRELLCALHRTHLYPFASAKCCTVCPAGGTDSTSLPSCQSRQHVPNSLTNRPTI